MIIPALSIEQDGPGIELAEQVDGVAIEMSDPVTDKGMVNREFRIGKGSRPC